MDRKPTKLGRLKRAYQSTREKRRWADSAARHLGLRRRWAWGYRFRVWLLSLGWVRGGAYTGEIDGVRVDVRAGLLWAGPGSLLRAETAMPFAWGTKATAKLAGPPPGLRVEPWTRWHRLFGWRSVACSADGMAIKTRPMSSLEPYLTDVLIARICPYTFNARRGKVTYAGEPTRQEFLAVARGAVAVASVL